MSAVDLDGLRRRMDGALAVLKTELAGLRTGRASASMLEPIMLVVVGGMVGFILVAMYLPIFSIAGNIQSE